MQENSSGSSTMDTVRAFNAELSTLLEIKPPISKTRMKLISKGAIKAAKFYKHVVHSVEKFIEECSSEYKIPGLYVIDAIVRQSRYQFGADNDVYAPRFSKNLQNTFMHLIKCPAEDMGKIVRVLNLWQKNSIFQSEVIQPLFDLANPNHPSRKEHMTTASQSNGSATAGGDVDRQHSEAKKKSGWIPLKVDRWLRDSNASSCSWMDSVDSSGISAENETVDLRAVNQVGASEACDPSVLIQIQQLQQILMQLQQGGLSIQLSQGPANQQVGMQQANSQLNIDHLQTLLTNPEVLRQLQALQQQLSVQNTNQENEEKLRKLQQMKQQEEEFEKHLAQLTQEIPRYSGRDSKSLQETREAEDRRQSSNVYSTTSMSQPPARILDVNTSASEKAIHPHGREQVDPEVEFVGAPHLPETSHSEDIIVLDGGSPASSTGDSKRKHHRSSDVADHSGSVSPLGNSKRRHHRSRSHRHHHRRRSRSRSRSRKRSRSRSHERDSSQQDDTKLEKEQEKMRERKKKGLPPIKKGHLSVYSTTLWVGHLAKTVQPEDLSDTFGVHGDIVSLDLISPRGCAFICMNRRQDAYIALQKLNGYKLHSKPITIAWAPGKGVKGKEWKEYWDAQIGVSYIPWDKLTSQTDLEAVEEGGMIDEETVPVFLKSQPQNMQPAESPTAVTAVPAIPAVVPAPLPVYTPLPVAIPVPSTVAQDSSVPQPARLGITGIPSQPPLMGAPPPPLPTGIPPPPPAPPVCLVPPFGMGNVTSAVGVSALELQNLLVQRGQMTQPANLTFTAAGRSVGVHHLQFPSVSANSMTMTATVPTTVAAETHIGSPFGVPLGLQRLSPAPPIPGTRREDPLVTDVTKDSTDLEVRSIDRQGIPSYSTPPPQSRVDSGRQTRCLPDTEDKRSGDREREYRISGRDNSRLSSTESGRDRGNREQNCSGSQERVPSGNLDRPWSEMSLADRLRTLAYGGSAPVMGDHILKPISDNKSKNSVEKDRGADRDRKRHRERDRSRSPGRSRSGRKRARDRSSDCPRGVERDGTWKTERDFDEKMTLPSLDTSNMLPPPANSEQLAVNPSPNNHFLGLRPEAPMLPGPRRELPSMAASGFLPPDSRVPFGLRTGVKEPVPAGPEIIENFDHGRMPRPFDPRFTDRESMENFDRRRHLENVDTHWVERHRLEGFDRARREEFDARWSDCKRLVDFDRQRYRDEFDDINIHQQPHPFERWGPPHEGFNPRQRSVNDIESWGPRHDFGWPSESIPEDYPPRARDPYGYRGMMEPRDSQRPEGFEQRPVYPLGPHHLFHPREQRHPMDMQDTARPAEIVHRRGWCKGQEPPGHRPWGRNIPLHQEKSGIGHEANAGNKLHSKERNQDSDQAEGRNLPPRGEVSEPVQNLILDSAENAGQSDEVSGRRKKSRWGERVSSGESVETTGKCQDEISEGDTVKDSRASELGNELNCGGVKDKAANESQGPAASSVETDTGSENSDMTRPPKVLLPQAGDNSSTNKLKQNVVEHTVDVLQKNTKGYDSAESVKECDTSVDSVGATSESGVFTPLQLSIDESHTCDTVETSGNVSVDNISEDNIEALSEDEPKESTSHSAVENGMNICVTKEHPGEVVSYIKDNSHNTILAGDSTPGSPQLLGDISNQVAAHSSGIDCDRTDSSIAQVDSGQTASYIREGINHNTLAANSKPNVLQSSTTENDRNSSSAATEICAEQIISQSQDKTHCSDITSNLMPHLKGESDGTSGHSPVLDSIGKDLPTDSISQSQDYNSCNNIANSSGPSNELSGCGSEGMVSHTSVVEDGSKGVCDSRGASLHEESSNNSTLGNNSEHAEGSVGITGDFSATENFCNMMSASGKPAFNLENGSGVCTLSGDTASGALQLKEEGIFPQCGNRSDSELPVATGEVNDECIQETNIECPENTANCADGHAEKIE